MNSRSITGKSISGRFAVAVLATICRLIYLNYTVRSLFPEQLFKAVPYEGKGPILRSYSRRGRQTFGRSGDLRIGQQPISLRSGSGKISWFVIAQAVVFRKSGVRKRQ